MGNVAITESRAGAVSTETSGCRHHWIIESAEMATSRGRCKLCGAEREFSNHPDRR
jgi:hypothetical protein